MKKLIELYKEHVGKVSDKWGSYIERYDSLFEPYRDQPIRLLEIGVQNGGSLELWSKYFTRAHIIGVDIDERCRLLHYNSDRIVVFVGDSKKVNIPLDFDIIIDDGSHVSPDIISNFEKYWPRLNEGGVYVIEDLHCSYWASHNDGSATSMEFLKAAIDRINSNIPSDLHSIEFSNSLCIMRKEDWKKNTLGERLIVGGDKII